MIEPSSINLQTLSSVSFNSRSRLPKTPCIYFVIDKQGVVQYIGQSINPKQRWSSHHKRTEVEAIPGARIAYLQVDADLLLEVELALIAWFNPPLNASEKSLANLINRSAPDNPGDTTATTVRIGSDDLEWLKSLPEGTSYHVRQAIKQYRASFEPESGK